MTMMMLLLMTMMMLLLLLNDHHLAARPYGPVYLRSMSMSNLSQLPLFLLLMLTQPPSNPLQPLGP
jgi:hypothetical protein